MLDPDNGQKNVMAFRKPRISTAHDRKQVARPTRDQMMTKKTEIVIIRPSMQSQNQRQMQDVAPKKTMELTQENRMTARQLKDSAIEKALASASRKDHSKTQDNHIHFGLKRVLLAMVCAAAAVFIIVYFVNLNAPNISLRVAAMQTGIEASYPSYIPRDFNLSDITSEDGKITLNFKNSTTGDAFSLVEEKSSWDSNTLFNNYVKEEYGDNYTIIKEQGLTLYISNSDATWVNGGIMYKLKTISGSLTKKQIKAIAVSL